MSCLSAVRVRSKSGVQKNDGISSAVGEPFRVRAHLRRKDTASLAILPKSVSVCAIKRNWRTN